MNAAIDRGTDAREQMGHGKAENHRYQDREIVEHLMRPVADA